MALTTDDCDLHDTKFYMSHGGNGDYYITLIEYPHPESLMSTKETQVISYRMAMSGGQTSHHPEVRRAFVELYRAMEKAGLNKHPEDDKYDK